VEVTVNTDDVLVFGQGVSDEFLNLYRAGLFRAAELDDLRQNGLREDWRANPPENNG
jgi:adenosine deaminase